MDMYAPCAMHVSLDAYTYVYTYIHMHFYAQVTSRAITSIGFVTSLAGYLHLADLGSQLGDLSSRSLHCLHLQLQHGLCKYVRIIPIPALCTELCGLREQYGHVVVELEKKERG
jgi:hypothetical protein